MVEGAGASGCGAALAENRAGGSFGGKHLVTEIAAELFQFVDGTRFRATCYRAANRMVLGSTTDRGKYDVYSPHDATYQYIVLPGASLRRTVERARKPAISVLANNDGIQAAWDKRLGVGMMAFRMPGSLKTPAGIATVDHICLLMIRRTAKGWKITAANPENLPLNLHVKMGKTEITMRLPGGNFAGSSIFSMKPVDRQ